MTEIPVVIVTSPRELQDEEQPGKEMHYPVQANRHDDSGLDPGTSFHDSSYMIFHDTSRIFPDKSMAFNTGSQRCDLSNVPKVMVLEEYDPERTEFLSLNSILIVMSIFFTSICWTGFNLLLGIPSIFLAVRARSDYRAGRRDLGKRKTVIAFVLTTTFVALGLGLFLFLMYFCINYGYFLGFY